MAVEQAGLHLQSVCTRGWN